MTHEEKAQALAEKIAKKAAATLERLEIEMNIMKWAPEFRVIMWDAVAHHASLNAQEARTEQLSPQEREAGAK